MLTSDDAGVEMAATYHSVISVVKLYWNSVWDFIGSFSKKSLIVVGAMFICILVII